MLVTEDNEQRLVSSVVEEAPWSSPFILEDRLFLPEGEKPVGDDPEDKRLPLMLFISDLSPFILLWMLVVLFSFAKIMDNFRECAAKSGHVP